MIKHFTLKLCLIAHFQLKLKKLFQGEITKKYTFKILHDLYLEIQQNKVKKLFS